MSRSTTIRRVSHSEILCVASSQQMIDEYSAECSQPDANPQHQIYTAMEQAGALQCFGAFRFLDHPLDAPTLVGFISVLSCVMPHNGKRVASLESFFVLSAHRDSGAGNDLLSAAEEFAAESGCTVLLYTARIGSTLETVLSRRSGCKASHTVFSRCL